MSRLLKLLIPTWLMACLCAHAADPLQVSFQGNDPRDLFLQVGQSQIINSSIALEQAVIGSPEVADIKVLSGQRVLVLGIKPGSTNLMLRPKGGEQVTFMNVTVSYDRNGIKRKIAESMPGEDRIEVRDSNDKVILAGQATSASSMEMALAIARSFIPADNVINLIQIGGSQQVMLEAKISEVSRNSLKELGVSTTILDGNSWSFGSGGPNVGAFGALGYFNVGGGIDVVSIALDALERKGLAKTLAEPNLVALSGQEANFLAGGEIPIPVAQASTGLGATITVEYKEFGVGLRFTPTVLDKDRINLKLISEVSAIDPSTSINIGSGIAIPAISTRRAGTTIELGDGQSFAIAGLMQSDMKNAIEQFPLLGDIPILGALFRSTDFRNNESELVLIITAHLVKPADSRQQLATPTDVFVAPNDLDHYLLGRLEGSPKTRSSNNAKAVSPGGVDGRFGHQLNTEKKNVR